MKTRSERPSLAKRFPSELLWNLTLRELRGKFKRSTLGWGWSIINPVVFLLIYSFVFSIVLRAVPPVGDPSGLHNYAFWLVCGLLPWTFLSNSVIGSAASLTANQDLVKKVYFPRSVLPTSAVLSWLVSFLIELGVLAVALLIVGNMVLPWLPLVLVITALLTAFVLGLALLISPLQAYFRDMEHLTTILLQVWFWATPIVWPVTLLEGTDRTFTVLGYNIIPAIPNLIRFNPVFQFVEAYRDVLYDLRVPSLGRWLGMLISATISILIGGLVFRRLEPRLAEEL
ncbi:MAG: Teichoic acid translocation permease protein TagG [Acidimicrobiales bacterium]|nr:MAG: ABC transporter permease [Actinomycetota bacterium]MBV6510342.1 Teichoic acid translocation permease protein TagG [Acidimicrobiales bacterium]RIK02899.1 MAG: ABC transporter permease [Acidobacteriota bacterium]